MPPRPLPAAPPAAIPTPEEARAIPQPEPPPPQPNLAIPPPEEAPATQAARSRPAALPEAAPEATPKSEPNLVKKGVGRLWRLMRHKNSGAR